MTIRARLSELRALVPTGPVARSGVTAAALRLAGMPCVLLLQYGLVRLLGSDAYGEFMYAYTWYLSLLPVSALGIHEAAVRFVAEYRRGRDPAALGGFLRWSRLVTAGGALAIAAAAGAVTWALEPRLTPTLFGALLLGWACLPVGSLSLLASSVLQGTERFAAALAPQRIVQPLVIIGIAYALVVGLGRPATATTAMMGLVVAGVVVLAMTAWLCASATRGEDLAAAGWHRRAEWRDAALHFLGLTLIPLFGRIDVIMLGVLETTRDAGIFATAVQLYILAGFGFYTLDYVIAPRMAALHAEGGRDRLQRLVGASTLAATAITLPFVLLLIAAGSWILTLFDPAFASGYVPLAILAGVQLFQAACGPVGRLLTMTGHHRIAFRLSAAAIALNVLLNWALIPVYGMVGAALATAASLVLRNVVGLLLVIRMSGLNPSLPAALSRTR